MVADRKDRAARPQSASLRTEAEQRKAALDLARAQRLREANAIPQTMLDEARAAYDAGTAAAAQAKSSGAPIEVQVAKGKAELAHAHVRSAEAELELAKLRLGYTEIKAPDNGLVVAVKVRQGG